MSDDLLAQQGISGSDLAALRQGQTCAHVQKVIDRAFRMVWIIVLVGFSTGAGAIAMWIMAATFVPEHTVKVAGIPLAWTAIFMVLPLICFPLAFHRACVLSRERSARIATCEGILQRGWTGGKARKRWITLDDTFFAVEQEPVLRDLFEHLPAGTRMRFYFTAQRRIVVGVEPVPVIPR